MSGVHRGGGGAGGVAPAHWEQYLLHVRNLSAEGNVAKLKEVMSEAQERLARCLDQPGAGGGAEGEVGPTADGEWAKLAAMMDIQEHSLAMVGLLSVCLRKSTNDNREQLLNSTAMFLSECNGEQIRLFPHIFAQLCHDYASHMIKRGKPIQGILPLTKAVSKIQLRDKMLTSVHSDICMLCLSAKIFAPARDLLNVDFTDISEDASAECKYILLYFYYGGMLLATVKNFARALHFFEICVTIPAVAVSHIMLEAYKKFILVALIDQGGKAKEIMTLPKYTSYVVSKYLQPLCSPYTELITSYYSNDLSSLQTTINKYADTYESDSNSGLVDQVLSSQTKTNIKRLTKTFLTLSLNELAVRVGLANSEEAEKLVVKMIQEGSIHAKISQKDGMVRFDNNPEHFNSSEVLETLEAKITRCMALDNQLQSLTEVIETNSDYVKRSGALAYSAGATSKEDPAQSMSFSNGSGAVSGSGPAAASSSSSGPAMGNGSVPYS
ncbi:hypothetical protein TCAL_02399 [Tigriopus californicus]|uniref:COP9 signalosome complex subunit 3 n=1 Tax=Tigriopus californicus TaxID=6832 RepID=A0A553P0I6_TIGCA|nr:COP9 signalosome complex subunit 3-like [Tigriopus californicus]TRY71112.1 hypothetical protein TCAL_02399 [Tigriopus californicus]|eukprot:TCALIF_02399-PA protein Name:"Similar to cops3 COP9 signalosome complex subunit 3 (Danio rerio)" AED:0.36 eAED:0.36 QI:0/0.8/0.66/0.83/1/1/6/107/495